MTKEEQRIKRFLKANEWETVDLVFLKKLCRKNGIPYNKVEKISRTHDDLTDGVNRSTLDSRTLEKEILYGIIERNIEYSYRGNGILGYGGIGFIY